MNAKSTLDVVSPFDDSRIGSVPLADQASVENALASTYAFFRNRDRWLALHKRVQILERAVGIMTERQEELALQAAREGGKPLTDSRIEISRAIDGVKLAIETISTDAGSVIPVATTGAGSKRLAFTQKEPVGVVVAVSAFNHPFNLIVHQLVAAIAAGCPCIVKPAKTTPLSCLSFVGILHEAGLPEDACFFLLPNDLSLSEKLITDTRVGFFSFIGSAKIGWMLRSKLAAGTRCALEHGGAAPLILAADARLELAVPAVTRGGFYHAGQVCVSVQRVFAASTIAREFAEQLAASATMLRVGDPVDEQTEVGPLIRPAEIDRVDEWVQDAVDGGAELLCGGSRLENNCYAPTVLFNPKNKSRVSQSEIFGPVVCVYDYENLDEAIAQANSLPFAFQASVFTENIDLALRVYKHINASAVMINDHTAFRVDGMPFAGLRESGYGVGGIPYTIHDMQIEKMMLVYSNEL